jgi:hypothetical protein
MSEELPIVDRQFSIARQSSIDHRKSAILPAGCAQNLRPTNQAWHNPKRKWPYILYVMYQTYETYKTYKTADVMTGPLRDQRDEAGK